jgi:adenylosuccinate lyase
MKVWESDGRMQLLDLLKQDEEVTAALSPEQLEEKFDLGYHFKHVDTIFARVFDAEAPTDGGELDEAPDAA